MIARARHPPADNTPSSCPALWAVAGAVRNAAPTVGEPSVCAIVNTKIVPPVGAVDVDLRLQFGRGGSFPTPAGERGSSPPRESGFGCKLRNPHVTFTFCNSFHLGSAKVSASPRALKGPLKSWVKTLATLPKVGGKAKVEAPDSSGPPTKPCGIAAIYDANLSRGRIRVGQRAVQEGAFKHESWDYGRLQRSAGVIPRKQRSIIQGPAGKGSFCGKSWQAHFILLSSPKGTNLPPEAVLRFPRC